jgi:hypothetical protein
LNECELKVFNVWFNVLKFILNLDL